MDSNQLFDLDDLICSILINKHPGPNIEAVTIDGSSAQQAAAFATWRSKTIDYFREDDVSAGDPAHLSFLDLLLCTPGSPLPAPALAAFAPLDNSMYAPLVSYVRATLRGPQTGPLVDAACAHAQRAHARPKCARVLEFLETHYLGGAADEESRKSGAEAGAQTGAPGAGSTSGASWVSWVVNKWRAISNQAYVSIDLRQLMLKCLFGIAITLVATVSLQLVTILEISLYRCIAGNPRWGVWAFLFALFLQVIPVIRFMETRSRTAPNYSGGGVGAFARYVGLSLMVGLGELIVCKLYVQHQKSMKNITPKKF